MEIQNIENWLQRLELRYVSEKTVQDTKIYNLEQQTKLFLQLASEVKELKDARIRQIQLNSEILEKLDKEIKPEIKPSFFSRLFK